MSMDKSTVNRTGSAAPAGGSANANAVYAKTIILGDNQSGRTELIHNLDIHQTLSSSGSENNSSNNESAKRNNRKFNIVIDESNFFSTIELTPAEVDHANVTAYLKVWEYTQHLSKKDEELAFRGALFCVITFDICNVQSYRSVFEKWIPLKEQMSPDSFLYIVGTHLDQFSYRQVELEEVCKACAKKDAVYVEVSNSTGANFQLLRRLLCRRVHFMLEQKDFFSSPAFQTTMKGNNFSATEREEEAKTAAKGVKQQQQQSSAPDISIASLEPNIMCSSVGAILSSCFDLEEWEGYEQQEQELLAVAEKIDAFVEDLANTAESNLSDLHSLSRNDTFQYHELANLNPISRSLEGEDESNNRQSEDAAFAETFSQLKEAFGILGLTMPESLLQNQPEADAMSFGNGGNQDPFALSSSARNNLRKMQVKLPGGHFADMVLDLESNIEQQIELFLLSNALNFDLEARKKLLQVTLRVQRDYFENMRNGVRSNNSSRPSTATTTIVSNIIPQFASSR